MNPTKCAPYPPHTGADSQSLEEFYPVDWAASLKTS